MAFVAYRLDDRVAFARAQDRPCPPTSGVIGALPLPRGAPARSASVLSPDAWATRWPAATRATFFCGHCEAPRRGCSTITAARPSRDAVAAEPDFHGFDKSPAYCARGFFVEDVIAVPNGLCWHRGCVRL